MNTDQAFDKDMPDRFKDYLGEKWVGDKNCPICKHNKWILGEDVVSPAVVTSPSRVKGFSYPLVFLACANCGHILFFSAILAGLVPQKIEEVVDG